MLNCKSTQDGIDIRNEAGNSCLAQNQAPGFNSFTTFHVSRLPRFVNDQAPGTALIHLWEIETNLKWAERIGELNGGGSHSGEPSALENTEDEHARIFFRGTGIELL